MAQALPISTPWRTDRLLTLPRRGTGRAASWMSLLALLAGLVCLMYLVTTSSVMGAGYDIQRLERERAEWRTRNEQLEYELAKVRSLTWVEAEAVGRLGMTRPKEVVYLRIEPPTMPAQP